jgi:hypothetical protein
MHKAPVIFMVEESIRQGFERIAAQEDKRLSKVTEIVFKWSVWQLREAGSLTRLLQCGIHLPEETPVPLRPHRSTNEKRG